MARTHAAGARDLINEAHQTCPYSKTVRGSIDLI
jgi:organic hydroperoxide reductase OsmC/OhrA